MILQQELPNKQELARIRNWSKMILTGFSPKINQGFYTDEEKESLKQVYEKIQTLLKEWDNNSRQLGFKVHPKRQRCLSCFKRRVCNDNVCRKCENAIIESGGDVLSEKQKQRIGLLI